MKYIKPTKIILDELEAHEQLALDECLTNIESHVRYNLDCVAFYEADKKVANLGVALPKFLKNVRAIASWPSIVVDSLEERLDITGFSVNGLSNSFVDNVWSENSLDCEYPQAHKEAFIHGVCFTAVTRGGMYDPDPVVTIESPLNTSGVYDSVTRGLSYALIVHRNEKNEIIAGTFFTKTKNIQFQRVHSNKFEITGIFEHNLERCMVERIVNNPRLTRVWGASEITKSVKYFTLGAMRTLCRSEVASEFFAAPQRYILGIDPDLLDGDNKYNAYIGAILGIPDDKDDFDYKRPELGEFSASSPQPFIDMVKCYSQLLAGESALPPQYLGFVTENPASADQIRAVEARHVKKAERRQTWFGDAWCRTLKNAYAITGGDVSDLKGLKCSWADASTPTRAATTDAIVKQVQAGILPPNSPVTLEQLGYSPVDIERIGKEGRVHNLIDKL